MNYLLVTPVKNEEKYLPILSECIINQTILPQVWIILDDGSNDGTPNIIKDLEQRFHWIRGVKFENTTKRDLDVHFGEICNFAFQEAMQYCEINNLPIDYLAKIDADIIIPKNCMEKVLQNFSEDKKIGIIGPYLEFVPNASVHEVELKEFLTNEHPHQRYDLLEPSDGLRIYRIEAYKAIGGIPETMAPDVVALAKAKLKGWVVKRSYDVKAIKTRETSSSIESIRNGYKMQGLRRYYLNYPPSILIFYAALEVYNKKPDLGWAMLSGYLSGVFNRKEKISDKEIRDYFRRKRPLEIAHKISR